MQEIEKIAELLNQLREADENRYVFGSDVHKYQLGPTLTETELQQFEQTRGVRLPDDYRLFLRQVGNGGAGPFYGLQTLEMAAYDRDLSRSFPFTKPTDTYSEQERKELEEQGDRDEEDEYPGVLELCHRGCAIYSYLVVNGPTYDTMWEGREDFYPKDISFLDWYCRWAERGLRTLANLPLVDKLTPGMTRAQVLAEVGGDWKERGPIGDHYLFAEPYIPAQLLLHPDNKTVVEVRRWYFI